MGAPHFFSVASAFLNQKYLSEKIEQTFAVFLGMEMHPTSKMLRVIIKKEFFIRITNITIND